MTVTETQVLVRVGDAHLPGTLSLPTHADGIVLFAHGSGSGRQSPRNRFVAEVLHEHRIATLLFDLLTAGEEAADLEGAAQLRFDIPLLADRLMGATTWLRDKGLTSDLPIGYFGASTGAAAALVAAAQMPDVVQAVVSRGGRPDLASPWLPKVQAATMLIVGSDDRHVAALNDDAHRQLTSQKRFAIVPGAGHLFSEPGTLDRVAHLAADWFRGHFSPLRSGDPRARMLGINHVALEVGDLDDALAFYGRLFRYELRGRSRHMAFLDMGDQFLALSVGREEVADAGRHFGLVVDDIDATREALDRAGVQPLPTARGLDFLDPWGNHIQVVDYREVQFTKAPQVLETLHPGELSKTPEAVEELRRKGIRAS